MDKKTLQHTLSQPFDLTQWQVLLKDVFGVKKFFNKPVEIPLSKNKEALAAYELGGFETADEKKIGLYLVKVKPEVWLERNRVGLRELLRNVYKHEVDGALIVFEQNEKWRLSFVSEIRTLDEKGNVVHNVTQPKRYTYLLGQGEKTKTPADRFNNVAGKKLYLEDIKQLFSVSTLTKEFYNELFQWYQWTLSEDVKITFPKNTKITEDDREKLEEQIIRLITRLLFVWFIKQKHLVPDLLFDANELKKVLKDFDPASSEDSNYYNAILQNLFFATLNKAVGERAFAKLKNARDIKTLYRYAEMFSVPERDVLELFRPIPFLNGGLFECLDKEDADGNQYFLDGFSRNDKKSGNGSYKHRAFIPNCVFFDEHRGILPLLQRYNFTVEEHAPEEIQVALDPELLGNVFENLLGAFNSETKDTARKQSGSFYTPREIVDYMVSESLISYLHNKCPKVEIEILRSLFEAESLPSELKENEKLCQELSDQMKLVKIIDPACGSGAFPMGILQKMVEVLEKLDIHHTKTAYEQKLHLIEECIYGADIQTIASQISKLRFFISLIVEQGNMDLSRPEDNYGVITLPNLETKFVAANTLIGLKKKPAQANLFEDPRIDEVKKEILEVRHEHFYAKTAHAKKQLREKDEKLRAELARLLATNGDFAPEDARQLAQWNPYDQNQSALFFDMEWMFGIKDGFDIVIGNPPYIQLQNDGGKLAKMYQDCGYKTFARTGDIYSLFYEKGWSLLKPLGHLIFITSNKWMRAGYGEATRKFFAENTNPILLIDFAGQKIFESATVDTNILLFARDKNRQQTQACIIKDKVLNKLSVFVRQQNAKCDFSNKESWIILSPIEQSIKKKIEAIGTPLKEWNIKIYRGILTGYNEAFIIDGKKKDELIAEDPKSAEVIRPILRGRDIKRYSYEFADLWLLYIPWHFPLHNTPTITGASEKAEKAFKAQYPAVYNHLLRYKKELENRNKAETGIRYEWYALQRWGANYMDDFSRQKIVWKRVGSLLRFCYDEAGTMALDSTCFATGEHIKFLVAVLNSKMGHYLMKDAPQTGTGDLLISVQAIEPLKIPVPDFDTEKKIEETIDKILMEQSETLEKELDKIIYSMYKLSKEEIDFIKLHL